MRLALVSSLWERLFEAFLFLCASVSILVSLGIVVVLVSESMPFFLQVPLSDFFGDTQWTPLFAQKHFGILPLLWGTFLTSLLALLVSLPIGIVIAIYLSEFASPLFSKCLKPVLEVLAGIPTIIYGYFALFVVTPLLQIIIPGLETFNALSAGLVMGFMILPTIASLAEDAFSTLPQSLRDAGYALGSTKLQVVWRILLPAARGGILAAILLGLSRAIGETMVVAIAAGQQPSLSLDPRQAIQTMTSYIAQVSMGDTPRGTLEYHTIYAVAAVLFLLTLVMNLISMAAKGGLQWRSSKPAANGKAQVKQRGNA